MVHEITGDALAFKDGIICHQTNYHGVMGAGIAAAIRHKLLTRQQYAEYVNTCMVEGRDLLGRVQYFKCRNDVIVANCFCQDEARQTTEDDDTITSYRDMRRCLKHDAAWLNEAASASVYPTRWAVVSRAAIGTRCDPSLRASLASPMWMPSL